MTAKKQNKRITPKKVKRSLISRLSTLTRKATIGTVASSADLAIAARDGIKKASSYVNVEVRKGWKA